MAKSSSHVNHVTAYLDPYLKRLVDADKIVNGCSKSEIVNKALRAHYDKLPERERQSIIDRSKNFY